MKPKPSISILLLSGYNPRAVLSFCRFLSINNLDFFIIAKDKDDEILQSSYKNKVKIIRKTKSLTVDDFIYWQKVIDKKLIIIPTTEYINRVILINRNILENSNFIIPLCEKKIYENVSNKFQFGSLCRKNGILVPQEYNTKNSEYPFVIKPRKYFCKNGDISKSPEIIFSEFEYNRFINENDIDDYYLQEFITGKSFYLLFYFCKNGNVSTYSQQNLIQQNNGSSIIAAYSSNFHESKYTDIFIKILKKKNFFGLIMIEMRAKDKNDVYMIEANPRLWGPSQLILDSNMNLWNYFINDCFGSNYLKIHNNYKKNIPYFWSGGIWNDSINNKEILFHKGYSKQKYLKDYWFLFSNDIYFRKDSLNIFYNEQSKRSSIEKLRSLYINTSKHSNYQKLPNSLSIFFKNKELYVNSRFEQERLDYICDKLKIYKKFILDIGSNTGYFSFEFLNKGAAFVTAYEGNREHTDFMKISSKLLGYEDNINIHNEYYSFSNISIKKKYDIVLLLNVLHHLGDDYGNTNFTLLDVKKKILSQLNSLSKNTKYIVFQIGFNWKGIKDKCLFKNGTKNEMIEYITNGIKNNYKVISIGIPKKKGNIIYYEDLNNENIKRDDTLGEFLNRPLFILQSISK